MARLKVFLTQSGFYDLAVAAPSQAAALRAWGIRQNLFAEGLAQVTTDKAIVEAALADPGMVLKRPLGTRGAFGMDAPLPKVKAAKTSKPDHAKARTAAREALARAQDELAQAEQEHEDAREALEREKQELDAKLREEARAWAARRQALKETGNRARRALRKA